MIVTRFDEALSYEPQKNWKRLSLCNQPDISIEHFVKAAGHASPRHQHVNAQVLVVLEGLLQIELDDGSSPILNVDDTVYIESNEWHVVRNPGDTNAVGLDIFVPGRSFDFWKNKNLK